MDKNCHNCRYLSDIYVSVCCSADSGRVADFVGEDDYCEHWKGGAPIENRCVVCGELIPDGIMICPICEKR